MEKIESRPPIQLTKADAQKLSQEKIFFGHQSVGDNITDGMKQLMETNTALKLNIVKTADSAMFDRPIFAHEYVGKNDDPESKIMAFRNYMQKDIANSADIAFFKFCFWDIRSKTDIRLVFNSYKAALSELKAKYPRVKFVHFTVPLMTHKEDLKVKIKRILNMDDETDMDNIRRNELNALLLGEYEGKEPIFDIAKVQSTLPDGRRTSIMVKGNNCYFLAQEYTYDGGHLNDLGKKVVAEQLLKFLSAL